jgi:hypothetical protein
LLRRGAVRLLWGAVRLLWGAVGLRGAVRLLRRPVGLLRLRRSVGLLRLPAWWLGCSRIPRRIAAGRVAVTWPAKSAWLHSRQVSVAGRPCGNRNSPRGMEGVNLGGRGTRRSVGVGRSRTSDVARP